jgi:hypothetical protein
MDKEHTLATDAPSTRISRGASVWEKSGLRGWKIRSELLTEPKHKVSDPRPLVLHKRD